jgi:hypothetical protein
MIGIITMLFYSIPSLSSSIANWDDEPDWMFEGQVRGWGG